MFYEDEALTKEVPRNSKGHYDVCLKEDGTVGQYYVGLPVRKEKQCKGTGNTGRNLQ